MTNERWQSCLTRKNIIFCSIYKVHGIIIYNEQNTRPLYKWTYSLNIFLISFFICLKTMPTYSLLDWFLLISFGIFKFYFLGTLLFIKRCWRARYVRLCSCLELWLWSITGWRLSLTLSPTILWQKIFTLSWRLDKGLPN